MSEPLSRFDPRNRRFEKLWNTFVHVKFPWIRGLPAEYWETRLVGEAHGPHQFVELQSSSPVLIDEVARHVSGTSAPILDLGCNVGRHINALYKLGYTNLYGVDVQREAFEHMDRVFPEVKKMAHLEQGTFQDYLPRVANHFFEVIFTHGATLELVPPPFPICRHLARATSRAVILAIDENGHAYPRLWETEFARAGFLLTKLLRPAAPDSCMSLLVFKPMSP